MSTKRFPDKMPCAKRYRSNVCAVLRHPQTGLVLTCHRAGFPFDTGWQFPQGGIDDRLDVVDELRRELREEIGDDNIVVVAVSSGLYKYDFPAPFPGSVLKGFAGQQQRWVLAELIRGDQNINFSHYPAEFDDFQWVSPQKAYEDVVGFKKDVYRSALQDLGLFEEGSCERFF